jgi:signal peptidase I
VPAVEPGREAGGQAGPKPAARARGYLLEVGETLLLTLLIFFGVQTFVAQPFEVEGASMERTVIEGQYVLIDKLTPHWEPYRRGDIVVLHPPFDESKSTTPFIKRVIGVAGDRVELEDGAVLVNGRRLDEPYVYAEGGGRQPTDPIGGASEWTVPADHVFVLGDHRGDSSDSRVFGPVPVSFVIGRAWLRYWPLDTFGPLD